jgi:cytosine/adenosine deaminase-related metal-dependent hydrolase
VIRYHARWVLPIARPPIRDGTVAEIGGRIAYVGPRAGAPPGEDRDLGDAALLPGLVNAHTHLELTAFRGLLAPRPFRDWIAALQGAKQAVMTSERYLDAARAGIAEGLLAGVTSYADTCDSGVVLEAMCEIGVRGIMYQEVFGPSPDPATVSEAAHGLREKLARSEPLETELQRLGVSPHAPYTVSDPLFTLVARSGRPIAIHCAESAEESALVRDGAGPFADALRARGIPVAPRAGSPVRLLERLGVLLAKPLLIHCVRVDEDDRRLLASRDCAVAHCPVSNATLGVGTAPVGDLLALGVRVGLGSDSMASNVRMDLLGEAAEAARSQRTGADQPGTIGADAALRLVTLGGAGALGLAERIGTLEPGKEADLAAFDLASVAGAADRRPAEALVFGTISRPARAVIVAGAVKVWDGQLIDADAGLATRVASIADVLAAHLRKDQSTVVTRQSSVGSS